MCTIFCLKNELNDGIPFRARLSICQCLYGTTHKEIYNLLFLLNYPCFPHAFFSLPRIVFTRQAVDQ